MADPIIPNTPDGVVLNCTGSSGATRVPLSGSGNNLHVANRGQFWGFLSWGTGTNFTAVAPGSTASYPILPNTKEAEVVIPVGTTHVAGVCATGETTQLIVHRTGS